VKDYFKVPQVRQLYRFWAEYPNIIHIQLPIKNIFNVLTDFFQEKKKTTTTATTTKSVKKPQAQKPPTKTVKKAPPRTVTKAPPRSQSNSYYQEDAKINAKEQGIII